MDGVLRSGDVYICDFSKTAIGSMQTGIRPCVVIDNTYTCVFSPCVHVVPFTSQYKKDLPLHYHVAIKEGGLSKDSTALCEQYTLIDKSQLKEKIGRVSQYDLIQIAENCKGNLPFNYKGGHI